MKDFFEKIGIYDFFVLLGSGSIMISVLFIINESFNYLDSATIYRYIKNNDGEYQLLPLIIISAFLGIVFQELSNIISNLTIDRNRRLLKKAFSTNNKKNINPLLNKYLITKDEEENAQKVCDVVKSSNNDLNNYLYRKCKRKYKETDDTTRIDHDQAISGMSRSLALFFLFLSICFFANLIVDLLALHVKPSKSIIAFVIFASLTLLFIFRYERFTIIRYSEIVSKIANDKTTVLSSDSDSDETTNRHESKKSADANAGNSSSNNPPPSSGQVENKKNKKKKRK